MATDEKLPGKPLKELQALAKARGLKNFSKLTKERLARLLAQSPMKAATAVAAPRRTGKGRSSKSTKTTRPTTKRATPATTTPANAPPPKPATTEPSRAAAGPTPSAAEEWVERTKYASRPNGRAPYEEFTDLGEDIDRLPALNDAVVCLLSQKPGVLHAYWLLPDDDAGDRNDYRLRLSRVAGTAVEICEEVAVPTRLGSWYFHVADTNNMLLQLGYYRDGQFVAARGRSVAQLPSFYASTHTDERWWISEADFMRMYLRAGGFVSAGRFGWNASIGSPGAAAAPGERLAWPGGVSSLTK